MKVLILVSIFVLSQAQFPFDTIPHEPWTGPIADHQICVHPGDTPEVAAAKAQHLRAYQDVLAVLPELPPEERYIKHGLPLPAVRALQEQAYQQQLSYVHHVQPMIQTHPPQIYPVPPVFPQIQTQEHAVQVPTSPFVPAEEIPRSPIGEVPEVHAARVAHLKAVQEAKAILPPLTV